MPVVERTITSEETIKARIHYYADLYGVSEVTMNHIVKAESNYNPSAINSTPREYSVGLVQINLKAHFQNGVTKEMALDIEYSLEFLAKNLKAGKCSMWSTCPL